jgi:tetratricopeptide (TPR) repeat protein
VAVVRNEKEQALADARRAVATAPANARARLALSYAAQASFDIPLAREQLEAAVEGEPGNALAWARLAEIRLAEGDTRAARRAAERAVALDPASARAWTVHGFVALARIDTRAAKAAFGRAIELDPFAPLPRLGLGLATIRDGDLAGGRERIELAVALDPGDALLRSYLGRAYFEERRDGVAGEEFATAKALDPNDPTPWFHDAVRQQLSNLPSQALKNLETALLLNDNRAVYRSGSLIEEDDASRGVTLARIYRDLGFIESGRTQAASALLADPANAAAHRFLSDLYHNEPRLEIARVSELLQAQLFSPLSREPLQPSLFFNDLDIVPRGNFLSRGFHEYSQYFEASGFQVTASGQVGTDRTRGDEVALSGILGRTSLSIGQYHYETEGFRENADIEHDVLQAFVQSELTPSVSLQAEYRLRDSLQGDRTLFFGFDDQEEIIGEQINPFLRRSIEEDVYRLGANIKLSSRATLILSLIRSDREINDNFFDPFDNSENISSNELKSEQAEIQLVQRLRRGAFILGGGVARTEGDSLTNVIYTDEEFPERFDADADADYLFGELRLPVGGFADLQARLGYDKVDPRRTSQSVLTPGLGLIVRPSARWMVRAAAGRSLKRPLTVNQTLAPTQIAGFSVLVDELDATITDQVGLATEYRATDWLRVGLDGALRESSRDELRFDQRTGGNDTVSAGTSEETARAYVYLLPSDNLAASFSVEAARYHRSWRDSEGLPIRIATVSVPAELRYFAPSGLFAGTRLRYLRQQVSEAETFQVGKQEFSGTDSGLLVDLELGYRLPGRRGFLALGIANLLDRELSYQDDQFRTSTDLNPVFLPTRSILLSAQIRF